MTKYHCGIILTETNRKTDRQKYRQTDGLEIPIDSYLSGGDG